MTAFFTPVSDSSSEHRSSNLIGRRSYIGSDLSSSSVKSLQLLGGPSLIPDPNERTLSPSNEESLSVPVIGNRSCRGTESRRATFLRAGSGRQGTSFERGEEYEAPGSRTTLYTGEVKLASKELAAPAKDEGGDLRWAELISGSKTSSRLT